MSEQGPPLLTALTDERDELEAREQQPANDPETLRHQLADEISRKFPGIDHNSVLKQAANITADLAGAEDVQQSFYTNLICLNDAELSNIVSMEKFVAASVRNLAIKWLKKHRPRGHQSVDADFDEKRIEDFTDLVADEDEINFMLNQIPEDCQEAFVRYFGEDYTAEEVAARLGIKAEALKKRLQRAVRALTEARRAYMERKK